MPQRIHQVRILRLQLEMLIQFWRSITNWSRSTPLGKLRYRKRLSLWKWYSWRRSRKNPKGAWERPDSYHSRQEWVVRQNRIRRKDGGIPPIKGFLDWEVNQRTHLFLAEKKEGLSIKSEKVHSRPLHQWLPQHLSSNRERICWN